MNNLTQFDFNTNQVRVILIDGQPWFVAVDICKVLGIANNRDALTRLKEYEKGVAITDTLGGKQEIAIISEPGLYRLALTSRKPQAEPFQDWVCQEVLPQIRKTGKYEPQPTLNIYARRVQIASKWDIPKGHWCVFHEISLLANKVGETYQVGEYDLIDGSVGKCWSNYRKAFDWIQPTIMFPIFFGDSRDAARIEVHGYQNIELPHFRDWLENVYTLERLPKYLTGKYGQLMKQD
jgi:prophage antirepressor-like protein